MTPAPLTAAQLDKLREKAQSVSQFHLLTIPRSKLLALLDMAQGREAWRPIEGWKLVPIEPTVKMRNAGACALSNCGFVHDPKEAWTEMVAAAPPAPEQS